LSAEIQVRVLDQSDEDLILASEAFDHPARPDQTRSFLIEPRNAIVGAVAEGALIGFASGTILIHPDKTPLLFVNEVGVDEGWRRRGIGKRLVATLNDWARSAGCDGIWLATEADNDPARALYRSLGARETGGVVVYDWDDALEP
jgi:ribosomal protein S18 acetylase RimI-like enzyme